MCDVDAVVAECSHRANKKITRNTRENEWHNAMKWKRLVQNSYENNNPKLGFKIVRHHIFWFAIVAGGWLEEREGDECMSMIF